MISLNYISICQSCRVNFNSYENLPLSFKCGHFFCKNCIIMNYTDSSYKVTCPVDGTTEKSIQVLKILKNLILDISQDSFDGNTANLIDKAKMKKNIPDSKLYKESSPKKSSLPTGKVFDNLIRISVNFIQIKPFLISSKILMNLYAFTVLSTFSRKILISILKSSLKSIKK